MIVKSNQYNKESENRQLFSSVITVEKLKNTEKLLPVIPNIIHREALMFGAISLVSFVPCKLFFNGTPYDKCYPLKGSMY